MKVLLCRVSYMMNTIYTECQLCWVSFMLRVIYAECHWCWVSFMLSAIYTECHLCWVSFMLTVTYTMLRIINKPFILSVITLNVIILSVVAPILIPLQISRKWEKNLEDLPRFLLLPDLRLQKRRPPDHAPARQRTPQNQNSWHLPVRERAGGQDRRKNVASTEGRHWEKSFETWWLFCPKGTFYFIPVPVVGYKPPISWLWVSVLPLCLSKWSTVHAGAILTNIRLDWRGKNTLAYWHQGPML